MDCPNCEEKNLGRDEVDIGVGIIYGPYGCYCGWSEAEEYNQLLDGVKPSTDPFGGYYP